MSTDRSPEHSPQSSNVEANESSGPTAAPTLRARLWKEIKSRPFGYSVLGVFLIAGPLGAPFLFPQAPPAAAIVGGLAFGIYAALSAVPQKFM